MKKPLIVSYSYSGHTHRIAQALCTMTGADWCEIYPWQPYPMAFPELLEQVRRELQTGYHPRLLSGAVSAGGFSMIFVGSPNWCGRVAPPLTSWLSGNDLKGKSIFPFYSHCGGVSCDFRREIARLCPNAKVREPLGVLEDPGEDLPHILRDWLEKNSLPELHAASAG